MRHGDRESLSAMAKAVTCSAMSHDVILWDVINVMWLDVIRCSVMRRDRWDVL